MWYILLCCGGILLRPYLFTPSVVSLRYSASLWWYPSSPLSLHARHGIVTEFGFAVAISFFALISSHPVWYYCGIQLRSGSILLRPYLFTPSVVLLWYSASRWRYPSSPLSLHARHGVVAVFGFVVAVSFFALISYLFLQVVVAALGHGDRERGLWREIIFDCDLMCFDTSGLVHSSSPYHPRGAPIFPCYRRKSRIAQKENLTKRKRNKTKQTATVQRGSKQPASSVGPKSQQFVDISWKGNFCSRMNGGKGGSAIPIPSWYSLDGHRCITGGSHVVAHAQCDFHVGGAVLVGGFVWL